MKNLLRMLPVCFLLAMAACSDDDYVLKQTDIVIEQPAEGLTAEVGQVCEVPVVSVNDENLVYQWFLDDKEISTSKTLGYTFEQAGTYALVLKVSQEANIFEYSVTITVKFAPVNEPSADATAYITKVFDFVPAVGQFTNTMPAYEDGDTQETMNQKVLESIGNNKKRMISLGGFGGYVTVGFDHTIMNVKGKRDFRVLGNAFYAAANPDSEAPEGGSCEPGVIMVGIDVNKNGVPDENEWYEIEGSGHKDPTKELWYNKAVEAGNDVSLYRDYEITYYKPEKEPESAEEFETYIKWEDNQGHSGYKVKNGFHKQCYFPLWISGDKLTLKGTCLPQNGVDESGVGNYYVLYKFKYGYIDNETNAKDDSAIDISWAVNKLGQPVELPGIDFIKVYTGVNQENGWLGECSTEVMGIEDLHILGTDIDTIPF